MRKEQKAQVIDQIAEKIDSAEAIYAVDYRGLSVPQAAELRTSLREAGASFSIVKNTLTLRAADKSTSDSAAKLKEFVSEGPTALTFISGDPAAAAKALDTFANRHKVLDFKGGTMGTEALTADDIRSIAKLPSRDSLNAQLAGVVASPLTTLVRGLGSMVSGMAVALGQVLKQKEAESPAAPEAESKPEGETPADATNTSDDTQATDGPDESDEETQEAG